MHVSTVRGRTLRCLPAVIALICAGFAVEPAPAAASVPTAAGVYGTHARHGSAARLVVAPDSRSFRINIFFRRFCGVGRYHTPYRGVLSLLTIRISASGRFRKKGVGRVGMGVQGARFVLAGRFTRGGHQALMRFRMRDPYHWGGGGCTAKVRLRLRRLRVGRALQPSDAGTYVGTTEQGRPLTLELGYEPRPPGGEFKLLDVRFTASMDCELVEDFRAPRRDVLGHFGGLTGRIPNFARWVNIESPDPPPWFSIQDLEIQGGRAAGVLVDVTNSSWFDANGYPTGVKADAVYDSCSLKVGEMESAETFTATRRSND